MKTLRNFLSGVAFVFAIGAAFAFKPANPLLTQAIQIKDGSCTDGFGPEDCTSTTATPKCTVTSNNYEFVADGVSCNTSSLGRP